MSEVTDVIDDIDVPEIKSSQRPRFNRERDQKETVEEESKETKEEEKETGEYPLAKYISHRHNINDTIRKKVLSVQKMLNDQSYRSYNARDLWKKKYTGGLQITIDDIEQTLDSTLNSGKYRGLSFRAVLSHDKKYVQWLTERNLFKNPDSLQWRVCDLLLEDDYRCRFHNQTILSELRQYKKKEKRRFESTYEGKHKRYKKY